MLRGRLLPYLRSIPRQPVRRPLIVCGLATVGAAWWLQNWTDASEKGAFESAGQVEDGLPFYTTAEVAEHKTRDNRIWVTYKQGVYDITDFIEGHPGGSRILLAAGGAIDPFWAMYAQHKTDDVASILSTLRIGNFQPDKDQPIDYSDPYGQDPKRHPALLVRTDKPFNAEAPKSILSGFITPTDLFYVRNHLPVPVVDPATYSLELLNEETKESVTLTLDQIKSLPKVSVTATIQCAGQRRNELKEVKQVRGLDWDIGAISTATWTGCRLTDVVKLLGITEENCDCTFDRETGASTGLCHVIFNGLDRDMEKNYAASIPVQKALSKYGDVILAYEMNGEELTRDHGYPLRAIVPGVVGARNVKWVDKVILSTQESTSHWQRNDYKGFGPNIDWDTVNFDSSPSIQELPVTSAISEPLPGDVINTEEIVVKGFAWSGGGKAICRVDVSSDGGKTWVQAKITKPIYEPPNRAWAWSPWEIIIPVTPDMEGKRVELCCKAVSSSYDIQPEHAAPIWNLRGVLSTAWHRVVVDVPKYGE